MIGFSVAFNAALKHSFLFHFQILFYFIFSSFLVGFGQFFFCFFFSLIFFRSLETHDNGGIIHVFSAHSFVSVLCMQYRKLIRRYDFNLIFVRYDLIDSNICFVGNMPKKKNDQLK